MTKPLTYDIPVVQVLLWYDQPEILLLKKDYAEYILAVSSGCPEDSDNTYIGASMTLSRIRDYQEGKCDLRYALLHANLRRYWKFEFNGDEPTAALAHIKKSNPKVALSLPDSGFFSREHDDITAVESYVSNTTETFDIDGGWELGEFSQFYGQFENVYFMIADADRFDDPQIDEGQKALISQAFEKPWRGGGSYRSFYREVANDNLATAPLKVSGIRYNSPGYVSIDAKKSTFDNVLILLQTYAANVEASRSSYRALRNFLSGNKLLRRDQTVYVSDDIKMGILERADELAKYLPGLPFEMFMEMSKRKHVVSAKVMLSVFRRIEKLYEFFDEGRVKYPSLKVD